jgi:site-specific recombinase XerD
MQLETVPGINWQGRQITTVMILKDGPLSNDSVVLVPTFYLLHLAKTAPINSLKAVASDLKRYFESLETGGRLWEDVSDDQMSGYIETTLLNKHKLSKRSITRHCIHIRGMYTHLSTSGFTDKFFDHSFRYLDENSFEEQGDTPPSENFRLRRKYINDPLFEILLEHASETSGFLRARNELILQLGHKLGLRSFEVTHARNLKLSDLKELLTLTTKANRLTCSMTIYGKRKKCRNVDIPPELLEKISSFIVDYGKEIRGNNLICSSEGNLLSASFSCRMFKKIRDAALPKLKLKLTELHEQDNAPYTISWNSIQRLTFHCLRHTYATNLVTYCYENGIDPYSYLPGQLGHAKYNTTKQYTNFQAAIYNRDKLRSRYSVEVNELG